MKKKSNISDETLKIIEEKQIKPIPRWKFVFKNWGLWMGVIVMLAMVIVGMGVSWLGIREKIISPYFWILVSTLFLLFSILLFAQTKKAYKLPTRIVLIAAIVMGLAGGALLFKTGWATRIDNDLEFRLPFYREAVPYREAAWNRPEQGYLGGRISKIIDGNKFEFIDFRGKIWVITTETAVIKGRVEIETGREIKIVGQMTGDFIFKAEEIRPWQGRRQNMLKEN